MRWRWRNRWWRWEIGMFVICYWLLIIGGRIFIDDPRSTIFNPLGELGVLAVNLFPAGVDLFPIDAD